MSVEVTVSGIRRPVWTRALARWCAAVCDEMGARSWELSVLLCDDAVIAALNEKYRGKKGPTDVLSFRQQDRKSPGLGDAVGDLVISLPTVRRNAEESGVSWEEELKRVAAHGILHLSGLDHGPRGGGPMIELQERIVKKLSRRRIRAASRRS